MRWHSLLSPALSGVDNMALDEALMDRARRTGEGVVRVYSWAEPTVSFGRNQRARNLYSFDQASALGVAIVRRATGGRALLHHREITYSVTAPSPGHHSLRASYRAINSVLLATLRTLGVPADAAARDARFTPPALAPCFERPAEGELTVGGRKLVGSAQIREDGAMLQHGSVLVFDDQGMLTSIATVPMGVVPPAACLADVMGYAPSAEDFADALFGVVRQEWDAALSELPADGALQVAADSARQRYQDARWTWRR